jgi:hypothetical protein
MSVPSVGTSQAPVSPVGTETEVHRGKAEPNRQANGENSSRTTKPTGAQPLNSSGRGQIINIIV